MIHSQSLTTSAIRTFYNESVTVRGVAASDLQPSRARVIGSRLAPARYSLLIRAESVEGANSIRLRVPVRVIASESVSLAPGSEVLVRGRLIETKERDVAALLIASGQIEIIGGLDPFRSGLERVRAQLRERAAAIGGDSGSLLPGLAIGDTSLQSAKFADLMRSAGLSHLTAVSGANFAIVSAFLFAIVGALVPRLGWQISITAAGLFTFIILVRPTPSVLRAAVMAAIFLLARATGSRRTGANALAVAVALLLLINPFQAFEPAFILSVSATAGLIFLAPTLQRRLSVYIWAPLAEVTAIAAAASFCCAPYLFYLAGSLSAATIPANMAVAPVIPIVTIAVFIAAIFVIPIPAISNVLLAGADLGARWIVWVANLSAGAPILAMHSALALLLAVTALIALLYRAKVAIIGLLGALAISLIPTLIFPGANWRVGQCDVGQGDALLINLGGGSAALFDAGPDPARLDRCLRDFGVKELALVVISHQHADHFAGFSGIGRRKIGAIWSNSSLVEGLAGREITRIESGVSASVGDLNLESIWPPRSAPSFANIAGDGSTENNRSVVLRATFAGVVILITGDIEPGAQSEIVRRFDLTDTDILKVAHHGSRFQDPEFLREVDADVALISVGTNNYGHPDVALIESLRGQGASVFRTDQAGSISVRWRLEDGRPIFSARKSGRQWWQIAWY